MEIFYITKIWQPTTKFFFVNIDHKKTSHHNKHTGNKRQFERQNDAPRLSNRYQPSTIPT